MGGERLKMKDLEAATGVGRETIRYYIREGLLPEPERPGRNVAYYDESFVERIALIKDLQQKRFLPLAMIKAVLDAGERATPEQAVVLGALDGKLFLDDQQPAARVRLSAAAERAGIAASEILDLAAVGLVEVETDRGDQWLDRDSARIAELWGTLRQAGFTEERGISTANMKLYADFVEVLVREELKLFASTVGPLVDGGEAARVGEAGVELVGEMFAHLRKRTVLRMLREANLPIGRDVAATSDDAG